MEKDKKLSFSIPSKPKPYPHLAADEVFSAADEDADDSSDPAPSPQFVTVFEPNQTLPSAPVIAPLPNSGRFFARRAAESSSPSSDTSVTAAVNDLTFVLESSSYPGIPSFHTPYGLTLRSTASEKGSPPPRIDARSGGDPTLRRLKEDIASLPDHRGADEFREVPVDRFGAAVLAGYGWSEGKGIGRYNVARDIKVVQYSRRAGTHGLGYSPSEADTKKAQFGQWTIGGAPENGDANKR